MTTQADKDAITGKLDEAKVLVEALAVDPNVNPLQAQLDAVLAANAGLQAKIDAARAAAQADKDADAAAVAGQGVLDALA